MNVRQVGQYLGVSEYSIYKYMRRGYLPYERRTHDGCMYYFKKDDVYKFKETGEHILKQTASRRTRYTVALKPKDGRAWRECPVCGDPMLYTRSMCLACRGSSMRDICDAGVHRA